MWMGIDTDVVTIVTIIRNFLPTMNTGRGAERELGALQPS